MFFNYKINMGTLSALMTTETIFTHLGLSLLLSLALGLEREFKNQPAGIRTHVLIGLGSTLLMILSIMVPDLYASTVKDHSRIAAQVVSGIGFLGAGAIIKMGMTTKGLTTAANIWVTSAIGLTVGAGLYEVAIIATGLILLSLIVFTNLKYKFIKRFSYGKLKLDFDKKKMSSTKIIKTLINLPINVISKNIKENDKSMTLYLTVKYKNKLDLYKIRTKLKKLNGLSKISISENIN